MRRLFYLFAFTALFFTGCGEKNLAELKLCSDISATEPCIGEDTVFLQGYNVWAQLWFRPGFNESVVTGSLYGYENGKRVFIESKVHEISEGQQVIMDAMFFNNTGNFEVEFTGSRGNLLAKKSFEVW